MPQMTSLIARKKAAAACCCELVHLQGNPHIVTGLDFKWFFLLIGQISLHTLLDDIDPKLKAHNRGLPGRQLASALRNRVSDLVRLKAIFHLVVHIYVEKHVTIFEKIHVLFKRNERPESHIFENIHS